jgi:hypothetical protein
LALAEQRHPGRGGVPDRHRQSLSGAIQEQLRQATGLPVSEIRSMADVVSRSTSRQRFNMLVMTIFGASALRLAAIGIYGLFGVEARDPLIFVGIPTLLTAVALLAVWLRAARASRVDPLVALRHE